MPGENDFLPFAVNGDANVATQAEYAGSEEQLRGMQPGLASSKLCNKVWRQASLMAATIGQIIADKDLNALDTGNINTLKQNFIMALTKIITDTVVVAATKLQTKRKINNVDFDGTSDIIVTDLHTKTTNCFRLRSGWQMCYGTRQLPSGSSGETITFPLPFDAVPNVQATVVNSSVALGIPTVDNASATFVTSSNNTSIRWIAVGSWS